MSRDVCKNQVVLIWFLQQVRDIVEGKVFVADQRTNKTDIEVLFGSGEFDIMPQDLMDASKVATIETILKICAFMSLKLPLQRTISIQQNFK